MSKEEKKRGKAKGFLKEFKDFAMRGNVMDLAIGVIIGGAFNKIVTSIVNDLFMPLLGLVMGNVNFSEMYIALDGNQYASAAQAAEAGTAVVNIGQFLSTVIDFILLAFIIFLMMKLINKYTTKPKEPEKPTTKKCPFCQTAIPIEAIRCGHCTSMLKEASVEE